MKRGICVKIRLLILCSFTLILMAGCNDANEENEEETTIGENEIVEDSDNENEEFDTDPSDGDQASEIESLKEEYEFEIESLKEEYKMVTDDYKEAIARYENFVEKAIDYLSEDDLLLLAKGEWDYEIVINEEPIPSSGEIDISESDFEIAFSERRTDFQILPDEIYNEGAISGDYFDHLTIEGVEPNDIQRTDGTIVTGFIYEFESLPSNTSFQLVLSDELKERLELETNTITINIQ